MDDADMQCDQCNYFDIDEDRMAIHKDIMHDKRDFILELLGLMGDSENANG